MARRDVGAETPKPKPPKHRVRVQPNPDNRPAPKPRAPAQQHTAFKPLTGNSAPFAAQTRAATHAHNEALRKLPANSKLPRIPAKKHYSQAERADIAARLRKARGARSGAQLYYDSTPRERHYLHTLGSILNGTYRVRSLKAGEPLPSTHIAKPFKDAETGVRHTSPALKLVKSKLAAPNGGNYANLAKLDTGFVGPATSAAAVAVGTYRRPGHVLAETAKSIPTAVAALPTAAIDTVLHPKQTIVALEKSQGTSFKDKVKRVEKQGALEDIGNAATLLGPVGKGLGRFVLKGADARAARLLSAGVHEARPAARHGAVRYVVGRGLDARKAAKLERKAAKGRPLTALENEALQANRKAGKVVAVVPFRSARKIAREGVAKPRGHAVAALKYDSAKGSFAKLAKERYGLNEDESRALWLGTEVGVRDPETARAIGTRIRDKMVASRGDYTPTGWERDMDVVAQIDKVLEHPEKSFTPRFAAAMDRIHQHAQEISANEPQFKDITKETRRRQAQAFALDLQPGAIPTQHLGPNGVPALRYHEEMPEEFNARVDAEAAKAGLAQSTYFRSEKQQGLEPDFGARTAGGAGPKSAGKVYGGKNLGQGIFDTSFDQLVRGYAHNLKATHNYPLIAKLDDHNRLRAFSPDSEPHGKVLGDLMNEVNRAEPRVKKGSIVFVNKGLFERKLDELPAEDAGHANPEEGMDAAAASALKDAIVKPGDAVSPEYARTTGWVAWPKEALRELEAELHAGTLGGRSLDIAKGKASQAILLTVNVPWLALQAASEGLVTGIASKGRALTPANLAGTARWWKAMNHTQRTHVATELGLGATGSDTAAIKLGATTNNRLVDAWRDLKSAEMWHRPRAALGGLPASTVINPVKWMRAADQGKTNVTRLLLAHSELTKRISPRGQDSLASAIVNMAKFGKDADRLLPVFKKPAPEQLAYLQAHPHVLEQMGENVSKALGDWTTMTAKERTWANRFVMFYPFVRYSTRLLFHTLPVDHPAVTAVMAELGQMKADEYRQVFGNDDLPWNIGKVYFGKTGDSEYIDLSRANPVLNAGISGLARVGTNSSNIPGAVVGSLPPYGQWMVDQLTGVNTFKGRPLRYGGDTAPFLRKPYDVSLAEHGKLALAEVQSLFYPAREAMARLHPETQSDDSSLLFPTPMKYKKPSEIKGGGREIAIRRATAKNAVANQQFAQQHSGGIADLLLGPLAPHASRDAQSSAERQYVARLQAAADKVAAQRKHYRDTHGGKNPTKPKSTFGGSRHKVFSGSGHKVFGG